jgi:hypothetical protein
MTETIIILASGPSVTKKQIRQTKGHQLMTINNMCFAAPWAQRHYAGDYRWWLAYHSRCVIPAKYTLSQQAATEFGLICAGMAMNRDNVHSDRLGYIGKSGNGGMQAVNLAYLLGYRRIILVGFDHQHTGGKAHNHPDHPEGWPNAEGVEVWQEKSPIIAKSIMATGVEIINCTRKTAIPADAIPQMTLTEALALDKHSLQKHAQRRGQILRTGAVFS